jgi:hypothetical protein
MTYDDSVLTALTSCFQVAFAVYVTKHFIENERDNAGTRKSEHARTVVSCSTRRGFESSANDDYLI